MKFVKQMYSESQINHQSRKTVLITGASSGIGADIAYFLAKDYDLLLLGRNRDRLDIVSKKTNAKGIIVCDLAKDIPNILQNVDILINNAGVAFSKTILELDLESFDLTMSTNLRAVFILTKIVIPNMIKNKFGRIINIGSNLSMQGAVGMSCYTASKSGLLGLTRSVAMELAPHNITCNVISPGYIKTPIHKTDFTDELERNIVNDLKIPILRLGVGLDVAAMVRFLISNEANYITGQNIHVNGGLFNSN